MTDTPDGAERRRKSDYCQQEILEKVNRIVEFIEGNGRPGAKVLLDRHERVLTVMVWAGGLLVMSCLGFAGWMVQTAFNRVFQ